MKNKTAHGISKKNYFITFILFVGLFGLTLYCSSWYKELKNYYTNNTIITDVVSEMEANSLPSYLQDNPEIIIYIAASNDTNVKSFEKQFKKYIIDNNLKDNIIYLDLAKESNKQILDMIKNNYLPASKKYISNIYSPNIIYFKDGVINDILYIKEKNISKEDMINFFNRNELLEK